MREKILKYVEDWMQKGYPDDIPDEVPLELMRLNLAPSYQAIALAVLRNDTSLQSIGYTPPKSQYYYALKSVEFSCRKESTKEAISYPTQGELFHDTERQTA